MVPVLLAIAPALSGCSFIGLGIGSAITNHETAAPPYDRSLAVGDELRVLIAPPAPAPPSAERPAQAATRLPRSVTGTYAFVRDDTLVIDVSTRRQRATPLHDVQKVERTTGSQWAAGLAIGAFLDLAAAALLINIYGHGLGRGIGGY